MADSLPVRSSKLIIVNVLKKIKPRCVTKQEAIYNRTLFVSNGNKAFKDNKKATCLADKFKTNRGPVPKTAHGACDYGGHCLALANAIKKCTPNAEVICKRGRQGSFEIVVNDGLIYSKLQTMALPDYEEVVNVVSDVSKGEEPREIKRQQPINCVIS